MREKLDVTSNCLRDLSSGVGRLTELTAVHFASNLLEAIELGLLRNHQDLTRRREIGQANRESQGESKWRRERRGGREEKKEEEREEGKGKRELEGAMHQLTKQQGSEQAGR